MSEQGGEGPRLRIVTDDQPELPYGTGEDANSGFSGSDTSEERARRADADGTTAYRQAQAMQSVWDRRAYGVTWKELAEQLGVHHGTASGVLSVLHKSEKIVRLKERRYGCKVYVLPDYVNGRDTEKQGRRRPAFDGEDITYEVSYMAGGDTVTWIKVASTAPIRSSEEAGKFVEAQRLARPLLYGDRPWKVVQVVRRTYHTLTY